jgi:hypothetical protein
MPQRVGGFTRVAHDPGDPMMISHCPLCGSGQVVGLSDGSVQCEFCGATFLVRIQPAFPGMPQSPMGPGAPSDINGDLAEGMPGGMPMDEMAPGEEGEEDGGGPPFGEDEGAPGEEGEEEEGPPEDEGEDEEGGAPPFPPKGKKKGSRRRTAGLREDTPENRGHYRRGWKASERAALSMSEGPSALERADSRGEHGAWYDGYMDDATGRPKYHSLTCPAAEHESDPQCTLNQRQASYRTLAGDQLPEEQYLRHLAVLHSGGSPEVMQRVRAGARG